MNAITKGVSLGLYEKSKERGLEASPSGAQPYVHLMGRRIPLLQTADGSWRALDRDSKPASPAEAFSYITRCLKQTTSSVLGAMRLLGDSHSSEDLNRVGWALYADFRPNVTAWGERAEIRCDRILELRKITMREANDTETEATTKSDADLRH